MNNRNDRKTATLIIQKIGEVVDFTDFLEQVLNFEEAGSGEVNKGPRESGASFRKRIAE